MNLRPPAPEPNTGVFAHVPVCSFFRKVFINEMFDEFFTKNGKQEVGKNVMLADFFTLSAEKYLYLEIKTTRKSNSKQELFDYDVAGRYKALCR
ncbi:MAG: hypothetical protein C7B47_14855 [Sulfobacillus thermosulfidooxidans]|uniref:Uncharacterized protein n=1 Tax=Sulfobacillus thermosulfidooxidans TaxID=28034 RepID=A0A2T2WQB9_SULTH|nr:MAG: hypothetical protein C7B47_14855 [Sulfobacillus thermosulfidooxidans]